MASFDLMNCKIGQYTYAPHRRNIGVWRCTHKDEHSASGTFICDFPTWDDAKAYVYKMNGWKLKTA